jgi:5,10-methenyltetrahydrofolate synthetase
MEGLEGFEPSTRGLRGRCSNQLSYRPAIWLKDINYPLVKTAAWDSHSQDARAIWMDSTGTTTRVPGNFRFDVLIVPVLGFDKNNHRLGFGGGFYDRFLAGQPKARKIGLAFEIGFITSNFPAEAHDVKLDMIITERKVYRA